MKRKTKFLRTILCILLCFFMLVPEIAAACTTCNYKTVYSYENATHHSYLAKCTVCGTTKTGWGYSGWSTHSFSSGTCSDCGYTCSHNFSDGTCTKCSYTCTHSNSKKVYTYENVGAGYHQHSYVTSCNTCGKTITGWGYSGWSSCSYATSGSVTCTYCNHTCSHNLKTTYVQKTDEKHAKTVSCSYGCAYGGTSQEGHNFVGDTCDLCGYTKVSSCSHTYTYTNHGSFTYNGTSYTHKGTCSKCQHVTYASKINDCSVCNPALVTAKVTMSVSGDMEVTSLPASYTVSATGTNCNVTSIYWLDSSGTKYTVKTGSSSSLSYTFTASSESAFPHSRVYYCTTSVSGVTGTTSVNFTYAKYAAAGIKWSKDGSTLRTISLNGKVIRDGLSIRLSSYQGATNSIPETYRSAIESAIGTVQPGVTYSLTCYGNAYSYYSADGMAITNRLADYYLYNQLDAMLSSQSWSSETKSAISSYRVMSAVLETSKPVSVTVNWVEVDANGKTVKTIGSKSMYGATKVYPSKNQAISVSYGSGPAALSDYNYVSTAWSGTTSGTSEERTYQESYTVNSSPLTVTFYARKKVVSGDITVKVVDANAGAAISGASITGGKSGTTSSAGTVSFADVPFGTYSFTASKSGYLSNSGSATINLSAQSTTVTIKLTPVGSVTVYVRDKVTNTLISGASISGSGSGTTSSLGSVSFGSLQIGTYTYSATKSGYIGGSGSASVTKAGDSLSVTIYLTPIGSVTVYVRDKATNALISGASITGSGSGTTNSSGTVSFGSLQIGTYSYTASKSGYLSGTGSASVTKAGDNLSVTLYLTPVGSVTVYVRDGNTNALISGATVSGAGTSGTTNSSGAVRFNNLQINNYSFTASASGYISNSGSASVTKAGDNLYVTIYLTPIGSITVYVRDQVTNALISGATVSGAGTSGTTNSSGVVRFSNLQIGSYSFTASATGYWNGSVSASVTKAGDAITATIYLTPIGSITVYARDKDTGALLSGVTITGAGTSGTTNSSGAVRFSNLTLGTYTFNASKYGYTSGTGSATLTYAGQATSITIYLENRTADVSITANPINGTVYRGSQIMVAATVHNDSVLGFKNTNPLSVTLTARKDGSTVISTQTKTVICPANESNLVWFPVDIPSSGYSAGNVQFTFSVSVPSGYVDPDMTNNTSSKTVTASVLPQRQVPDPDFQLEAPSSFTYSKYQNKTANTRTWSVWEWNGSFVKRTYDASLTTKAALSPDTTAGWSKYNSTNQLWTTRSGYGFNTAVTVSLSGVPTDMFAGHAKVNAYYPEFGYASAQDKSSMLRMESENTGGYTAEFTFASNTDTISKNKMHVTPVWFPDGAYSVKYEVYDVWTPSGVLTAGTYAIINIEGSMYDDYYTQRN